MSTSGGSSSTSDSSQQMPRRRRRLPAGWPGWLALALVILLGLGAIIFGAWKANLTHAMWLEVAKGGIQVIAVGVLGGALAAIWRSITTRRERQMERNEKLRAELASLVAVYNGVKAVRRTLRSLGLDLKDKRRPQNTIGAAVLTEEQARGFHAQMLILNGLQLDFESRMRQFGQTDFLGKDTDGVVKDLRTIENHLNHVLGLWEHKGWTIQGGTLLDVVSDGLQGLFRASRFIPNVSQPLRDITRLINEHMYGEARNETKKTMEDTYANDDKQDEKDVTLTDAVLQTS
jgi:hypothetical protein